MIFRVAAALFLLGTLPVLAQGPGAPHARCLTPLMVEHAFSPEKLDPSLHEVLSTLCPGPHSNDGRPIKQHNFVTPGGRFRVHYDTEGDNAVPLVDADGNSRPDFVDSVVFYMEHAWHFEIDTLGYAAPPLENRGPGPEIDIYICELGIGYYGGAQPESDNVVGNDPFRAHGYMLLDNDFVGFQTAPMNALRVTTAHEFHHIIQFSAYRTQISQVAFYEATSTWMEEEVHPDVDDWDQYVEELLRNPQDYGFSTHNVGDMVTGYGHMLYMEYIEKRFGRNAIREFWEEFRLRDAFDAIDYVLSRRNFNLTRSYCEFAEWSYYTGYRARDTTLLRQAPALPALRPAASQALVQSDATFEAELYPLSFGLYRLLVPSDNINVRDTVDFLVTNGRSNFGPGGPSIPKEGFRIDVSTVAHADYLPLPRSSGDLHYRLTPLSGATADAFCLDVISDSLRSHLALRTSPQPFINRAGEEMIFAVGAGAEEIRHVRVRIYTAGMTRVRDIDAAQLGSRDNQLGILWNGLDNDGNRAPSGIYIFEMEINDELPAIIGKFAVVRE